jgi:cytochrome P450
MTTNFRDVDPNLVVADDIFSPENIADPYAMFRRFRSRGPVVYSRRIDGWLVMGFDAVSAVLQDSASFSNRLSIWGRDMAERLGQHSPLIALDGDAHKRTRSITQRVFSPSALAQQWEPRIREIVQEHVGQIRAKERFRVVGDLAVPVPIRVIAEMLGLDHDAEKVREIKRLSDAVIDFLGHTNDDRFQAREDAFMGSPQDSLYSYLFAEMTRKQESPGDDLISRMLSAEVEIDGVPQRLDAMEVFYFASLLLMAGNETTTHLIAQCLWYLARHSDILGRIGVEKQLIPATVEEVLRLEAPSQAFYREATCDTSVEGVPIRSGDPLLVSFAAAGRDPGQYEHPEEFRPDRRGVKHLAFGAGAHFCMGAGLARLEACAVLEAVVDRFCEWAEPDGQVVTWRDTPLFRGPEELELVFR